MSSPCTTSTNFSHGDLREHFVIFPITIAAALIPFSVSRCHDLAGCLVPYKQPPQSSAASCPGVEFVVVRQFDEGLWERLCTELCTPDVNVCHKVILVPSGRRSVTEYTLHQFQSRSWSVMLTVGNVHPFVLLCNPSSPDVWFLGRSFVRDNPFGSDHFPSTCLLSFDSSTFIYSMYFYSSVLP